MSEEKVALHMEVVPAGTEAAPDRHLAFFGLRLVSCPVARALDRSRAAVEEEHLRLHTDLLNALFAPASDTVVALRYVSQPGEKAFAAGRIDVALLARAEGPGRDAACARAQGLLGELASLLGGMMPDYVFEGLADVESFARVWRPFDLDGASFGEVRRREEELRLESSMPRPALGRGRRMGPPEHDPDALYFVHPFLPRAGSLTRLLGAMLLHRHPLLLQVTATPTRLAAHEEQALTEAIRRCESIEQSAMHVRDVAPAVSVQQRRASAVARALLDQLVRIQDAPYLLAVTLASPHPIPAALLEATGVEITAPVGLAEGRGDPVAEPLQMGGYDVVVAEAPEDFSEARRTLAALEWSPWGTTLAPRELRRLRALMDAREAAAAFRLPIAGTGGLPGIDVRSARTLPIPREVAGLADGPPARDELSLGVNRHLGQPLDVRLLEADRRQHVYVIGQTGTGKTTLLKSMALGDIAAGRGVALIDPHGDLFEEVLGSIPASRRDDVVVFEPTQMDFPVGLNLLECESDDDRYFVVREMRSVMARLLGDLYQHKAAEYTGPVFYQHMQMNMLLAMSDAACPGTLLEFYEIFQHEHFWRRWLPLRWRDSLLERWVRSNLPKIDYTRRSSENLSHGEYLSSKFEDFVFDPRLRLIFGQRRSTFDLVEIMNGGKILLVNLAKGHLSEANARFLGMVLMAKIQAAAMSRVRIPAAERRPFYVYVDEFQALATDSFVLLLSEARKFGLGLVLANQFASQIEDNKIRDAIFGNVGTIVAFRVGQADAELLEPRFVPYFDRLDLSNLPNWQACVRTTVRGQIVPAFTLETVPPVVPADPAVASDVRERSRQRHGRPRATVEKEISVSLGSGPRRELLAGSVIASATYAPLWTKGDAHSQTVVATVDLAVSLLVVCDAVSTSRKGPEASSMACEEVANRFGKAVALSDDAEEAIGTGVRGADSKVYSELHGEGTCALVVAAVEPDSLTVYLASVGGARAFAFEGGTLRRLVGVETEAAAPPGGSASDAGASEAEAVKPVRPAIGQREDLTVRVTTLRLERPGALICLASGGVSEASLTRFLQSAPSPIDDNAVAGACRAMAEESGEEATLVVMRVGEVAESDGTARSG